MSQIPHPKQPIELNAASVLGQDAGTVASPLVVKIGGALLENAAQHLDPFRAVRTCTCWESSRHKESARWDSRSLMAVCANVVTRPNMPLMQAKWARS